MPVLCEGFCWHLWQVPAVPLIYSAERRREGGREGGREAFSSMLVAVMQALALGQSRITATGIRTSRSGLCCLRDLRFATTLRQRRRVAVQGKRPGTAARSVFNSDVVRNAVTEGQAPFSIIDAQEAHGPIPGLLGRAMTANTT